MRRVSFRLMLVVATVAVSVLIPSCGRDQELVQITIDPQDATLETIGTQVQFRATGLYRQPRETRDITTKVVWSVSAPQIISVDSTGLATYINGCGTNLPVSATAYSNPQEPSAGAAIVGTTTVNGQDKALCGTQP